MNHWLIVAGALIAAAVPVVAGVLWLKSLRGRQSAGRTAAEPAARPAAHAPAPRPQPVAAAVVAESQAGLPSADWFAQLTLNTPDDDDFSGMLGMLGDGVGPVEQARLRICMAVAHVVLLLWYFDRVGSVLGPEMPLAYRDALRADLEMNAFDVRIEDYVVDANELGAFHAAARAGAGAGIGGSPDSTRTPDLIDRLVVVRGAALRAALDADFSEPDDGFRIPFSRTGNLVVAQFAGRDAGSLPSGDILAAMIGQELGATVKTVVNALRPALAAVVGS